ncbi:MAG: DUF2892 domain-containing protein [Gemmatimonadaceae bacterium]
MLINEGWWDRLIRIALGIAILMFVPRTAWAWLGLLPLVTGAVGYCPMYHLFRLSTNRTRKDHLSPGAG